MGFVVPDIDKVMHTGSTFAGSGPKYLAEQLPLDGFWHKERRHDGIDLTIALASSGEVQLVLIPAA